MVIFYSFNVKALVYIFPFTAHFFLKPICLSFYCMAACIVLSSKVITFVTL